MPGCSAWCCGRLSPWVGCPIPTTRTRTCSLSASQTHPTKCSSPLTAPTSGTQSCLGAGTSLASDPRSRPSTETSGHLRPARKDCPQCKTTKTLCPLRLQKNQNKFYQFWEGKRIKKKKHCKN